MPRQVAAIAAGIRGAAIQTKGRTVGLDMT